MAFSIIGCRENFVMPNFKNSSEIDQTTWKSSYLYFWMSIYIFVYEISSFNVHKGFDAVEILATHNGTTYNAGVRYVGTLENVKNTKLESPSSSRYNMFDIYSENGRNYFNLNLQIRFIK